MADTAEEAAKLALDVDRAHALAAVHAGAGKELRATLERAQRDLETRLAKVGGREPTFSVAQMRAALAQVKEVIRTIVAEMREQLPSNAREASASSAEATMKYLKDLDGVFRGSAQPLALSEARALTRAISGAETSVLDRISMGPDGAKGKVGILQRYGVETVGKFEETLAAGLVSKKPWADLRDEITEASPFLQGAPAHWAERIVRTEVMAASNRGSLEVIRQADEDMGDMVKIVVAVFDERTASDSYATHGQIRRPDEEFETWYGPIMSPPDRPNDRGSMVPHRVAWPLPGYLKWKSSADVSAAWKREKRKGSPPPRPLMTTVSVSSFGRRKIADDESG